MRYFAAGLVIALCGVLAAVGQTGTTPADSGPPTPGMAPTSWELEFKHEALQSIRVVPPGETQPQTFWYLLWTVTNRSGADQLFVPDFILYTDTGQILRAGMGVPRAVFTAIKKRHNNPLLNNLADITGRILQGSDNAKDGVAIWTDYDPAARDFDIFVGGLSGERARVKLPAPITVEEKGDDGKLHEVVKHEVVLAKTLRLAYRLLGEAESRLGKEPTLTETEWVMR